MTARPTERIVDNAGMLQCFYERLVCSMYIAKCDDSLDILELPLLGRNWLQNCSKGDQQNAFSCKHNNQIV